jgi:acyl transferase domain-containing protein
MRLALVFPGQGAQHPGMAVDLYRSEPVFAAAIDEVFAAFGDAGPPLRADWLSEQPLVGIDEVTRSTPLLFAVDYALGRLVISWGVKPAALLGHSIGEIAAATLAGVVELTDIAPVIAARVAQLEQGPAGAMVAVAAGPADVAPYLGGDLVVGAVNAPRQIILAGPVFEAEQALAAMRRDGLICRRVPALHPFHSPAMAGVAALGTELFASVPLRPPAVPVYSAYLGRRMTVADALDRPFWIRQPAAPVMFWPALEALLADGDAMLVEAGPGEGLTTLARLHPRLKGGSKAVALLPRRGEPLTAARTALLTPAG